MNYLPNRATGRLSPRARLSAVLIATMLISLPAHAESGAQEPWVTDLGASLNYDSRYIGSGRNNSLGEGGHFVLNAYAGLFDIFTLDLWQSVGTHLDINETNLTLTAEWGNDDFVIGGGYRYLYFDDDEANATGNDDELLIYISAPSLLFEPTLEYLYSDEADGGILYLRGSHSFELASGELTLGGEVGYQDGYLPDAGHGMNHLLFSAEWAYQLSEAMSFNAHISQVVALESLHQRGDTNWTYGGVGLSFGM